MKKLNTEEANDVNRSLEISRSPTQGKKNFKTLKQKKVQPSKSSIRGQSPNRAKSNRRTPKRVQIKDSRHVIMDNEDYEIRDGRFSITKETPEVLTTTYTPIVEVIKQEDFPVAQLTQKVYRVLPDGSRHLIREEYGPYKVVQKRSSSYTYGPRTTTHRTVRPSTKTIIREEYPLDQQNSMKNSQSIHRTVQSLSPSRAIKKLEKHLNVSYHYPAGEEKSYSQRDMISKKSKKVKKKKKTTAHDRCKSQGVINKKGKKKGAKSKKKAVSRRGNISHRSFKQVKSKKTRKLKTLDSPIQDQYTEALTMTAGLNSSREHARSYRNAYSQKARTVGQGRGHISTIDTEIKGIHDKIDSIMNHLNLKEEQKAQAQNKFSKTEDGFGKRMKKQFKKKASTTRVQIQPTLGHPSNIPVGKSTSKKSQNTQDHIKIAKSYHQGVTNLPKEFSSTHNGVFHTVDKPDRDSRIVPRRQVMVSPLTDFDQIMAARYTTGGSIEEEFTLKRDSNWKEQNLVTLPDQRMELNNSVEIKHYTPGAKFSTFGTAQVQRQNQTAEEKFNKDLKFYPEDFTNSTLSHHELTQKVKSIQKRNGQDGRLSKGKKKTQSKKRGLSKKKSIDFEELNSEFGQKNNSYDLETGSWRQNTGFNGRMTPISDSIKSHHNFNIQEQFDLGNVSKTKKKGLRMSSSARNFRKNKKKGSTSSSSKQPNYEYLRRLHSSTQDKNRALKKQYEMMFKTHESKELDQCTFKPQINKQNAYKTSVGFEERQRRWLEAKEERSKKVKELIDQLEMEKCNFGGFKAKQLRQSPIHQDRVK